MQRVLYTTISVWFSLAARLIAASVPGPSEAEMESLAGQELPHPVKVLEWSAPEPRQTNLDVYAVQPEKFDEGRLRKIAEAFGVKGQVAPLPSSYTRAPGYWVKEPNSTNSRIWECVIWSNLGEIVYSSGDDGRRWDLAAHRPLVTNVPTAEAALEKAMALLPVLGVTTNDFDYDSNGKLRWGSGDSTMSFNDRSTGERKSVATLRTVGIAQRLPNGGKVESVGGGGTLSVGFISEGKLAKVEFLFRPVKSVGKANPLSKKEVIKQLEQGKAWTWLAMPPQSITVTNCILVYPQGNHLLRQNYLYPFYKVTGFSVSEGETNSASFLVPLSW